MKIKKQSIVALLRRIADDIEKADHVNHFNVLSIDFTKTNWHAEVQLIIDNSSYECALKFAPVESDFVHNKAMQNIETPKKSVVIAQ